MLQQNLGNPLAAVWLIWCGIGILLAAVTAAAADASSPRGVRLDDFTTDAAPWEFFPGTEFRGATGSLTLVNDLPSAGDKALKLTGDFSAGGRYVAATRKLVMPEGHDLARIRLRVMTHDVHQITVRLADGSGQIHQRRNVRVTADGQWHDLVLEVEQIAGGEHWGGANDGKWHGPATLVSINIGTMSNPDAQQVTMHLADIRAEVLDAAVIEGNDTVQAGTTILQVEPAHSLTQADYGFHIHYRWQSRPMQRDYTVFVHIVDESGQTVYQDDHAPPIPTSQWDGLIEYERAICLPRWVPRGRETFDALPEGRYTLWAGLYNRLGRKPLAAGPGVEEDDQRRFRIGSFTIDRNAPIPPLPSPTLDLSDYELTFSEEFDEDIKVSAWGPITPDGARWIAHTPYRGDFGDARFANPEPGFPFTVKDGILTIEARKQGTRWYSGLISSVDTEGRGFAQQYGYFEMRARFPHAPGTWPAFWLHGLDRVTHAEDTSRLIIEIDIVEHYGHHPNKLSTAIHQWDRSGQGRGKHHGVRHLVPGMTEDFHTYGAEVTPEFIIFYFDGIEIRREKTPECGHRPLYIMANLALGPGWPLDKTPSPVFMEIDYIRAYQKKGR